MAKSTAAYAAARFKQLSCLGLEREAVIPELLKELHDLIPSFCNTFLFANDRGGLANAYYENPEAIKSFPLYQQIFLEGREREFKGYGFSEAARTQVGVQDFRSGVSVAEKIFHRSDLYNLIVRPAGYDSNFLRLYFRERGRIHGGLTMWRSPNAGNWTLEERRRLASLEGFFLHALTARADGGAPLVDSGDIGMIIANSAGKPLHFSASGRKLLFLASSPRNSASTVVSRPDALPVPVAQLCGSLSRIFTDDASGPVPSYYHSNVWGGFTFRAEWLHRDDPSSGLIGITVSHKVPLAVRLIRSVRQLPLSRRQAEICVLMATGASNEAVSERLGISKYTAKEHGRWIYNKLDVHSRAELVSKMLLVE